MFTSSLQNNDMFIKLTLHPKLGLGLGLILDFTLAENKDGYQFCDWLF